MRTLLPVGILLAAALSLAAQETDHLAFFQQAVPAGRVGFFAGQMVGSGVKASPYSAESIVETTQTLADGNRIIDKNTTKVFRDSEGRERREMNFGGNVQIMISDPVAGVSYALSVATKTAQKMPVAQMAPVPPGAPPPPPPPPGAGTTIQAPRAIFINRQNVAIYSASGERPKVDEENLGAKTLEGVMVQGTRVKSTIPAGEIGNERAIETVTETWYSPDLKMTVLSETSDPRMGKTVMKLTNINRSEPSRSLFEVPPGYTVQEGPHVVTDTIQGTAAGGFVRTTIGKP